jgi:hypothetical protein
MGPPRKGGVTGRPLRSLAVAASPAAGLLWLLLGERPTLPLDATAIAGEVPGASRDAMAGHDQVDRIERPSQPDSPRGAGHADTGCNLPITARLSSRNLSRRRPDGTLEWLAARVWRHLVKRCRTAR